MSTPTQTTLPNLINIVVWLGESLETAISTQWVVLIVVPILTVGGAVALKRHAKKIRVLEPIDKLFGFDLGLTACLTLLVSGFVLVNNVATKFAPGQRQHYIVGLFILLAVFIGAMIWASSAMHKRGWDSSKPPTLQGVVPNVVNIGGLVFLVIAFVLTGGASK